MHLDVTHIFSTVPAVCDFPHQSHVPHTSNLRVGVISAHFNLLSGVAGSWQVAISGGRSYVISTLV